MDTHGLNILVDPKEAARNKRPYQGEDLLVRWVMERVEYWEQQRNTNYMERWDEYYRIWRTEWSADDRQRMVERSRIMPTDLSESVTKVTAELTDAFFGRSVWMDIDDDAADLNKDDVREMARKLREDAETTGLKSELDKAFFNGALYGTGIVKAVVGQRDVAEPTQLVDNFGREVLGGATINRKPFVSAVAVSPREFVIDPAARSIDDALGCAHIITVPRHHVLEGQRAGIYQAGGVPDYAGTSADPYNIEGSAGATRDKVRLVEYHGLVPAALLPDNNRRVSADQRRKIVDGIDSSVDMVEAIILIANDSMRLKAVENPYIPQRRSFFAYQHEAVPDAFWGRGIVEAGYHPYKALQTEIRARADGLALANYPTVWRDEASLPGDQTRDDPDEKIIAPGKEYLVSGDPNKAIREFKFSGPDRGSSQAIADYQRMIESATGSFGFQGAMLSSKDSTVAGSSMALQTFLRRSKRTALAIESGLMAPLIEALAWRSMQYMPKRFPPLDFKFMPKGALGILQRDAERATLLEVLRTIPPESAAFYAVLRLVIESGPYEQRMELLAIMDSMIATALNPPPPPRDLGGEARLMSAQQRIQEHNDEVALEFEKLKREDVALLIKARDAASGEKEGGGEKKGSEEINVNINQGGKRVRIRRTEDGLVGETEDMQ